MSPSKAGIKPATPVSVKWLMIVEALILLCLAGWVANDYRYNIYMQMYWNTVVGAHVTTYTMIIGVIVGLAGTFTAFTFWKNLRAARLRLEHMSTPRLRGPVNKALSVLPTIDEETYSALSTQRSNMPRIPVAAAAPQREGLPAAQSSPETRPE